MTYPADVPAASPADMPSPVSPDPASPAPPAEPDPAASLREKVVQATMPEMGIYGGLAVLPPDALVELPALVNLLGLSRCTIERMVQRHDLPPPILLGRRRWRVGDINEYIGAATKHAAVLAEREAEKQRETERRCLPPGSRRRLRALTPGG